MNPMGLIFLITGLIMVCSGAFVVFVKGDPIGTVFMGTGTTFIALSVIFGVVMKKKQDEGKGE